MAIIESKLEEKKAPYADINATYEFQLTDAEEETYQLELSRGSASIHDSSAKEADCVLKMKEKHFRKFLQGELNSTSAFMTGKLKVGGNIGLALKLDNMLKQYNFGG